MRRLFFLAFLVAGCDSSEPPTPIDSPSAPAVLPLWSGPTGSVTGRVEWPGLQPQPVNIETYRPATGGRAEHIVR